MATAVQVRLETCNRIAVWKANHRSAVTAQSPPSAVLEAGRGRCGRLACGRGSIAPCGRTRAQGFEFAACVRPNPNARSRRRVAAARAFSWTGRCIEDAVEDPIVDFVHQRLPIGEATGDAPFGVDTLLLAIRRDDVFFDRQVPALIVVLCDLLEIGSPAAALREQRAMDQSGAVGTGGGPF